MQRASDKEHHTSFSKGSDITQRTFIRIFLVMLAASITLILATFIDGIVIGSYLSTEEMAAFGLVSPVLVLFMAIAGIFTSGAQILCGNSSAVADQNKINGIFSLTCVLSAVVSVILMLLFVFFADNITAFLGAEGFIFSYAKEYLIGLSIGIPGIVLSYFLAPILQMDSDRKMAVLVVIVMTASHIAVVFLNIKILHGGLYWMGLATSLSSYIALFIMILHFFKKESRYRFSMQKIKWSESGRLLKTGFPTAMNRFFSTFRSLVLNYLLITFFTTYSVAAFSIRMNLGNFMAACGTAVGMTVITIAGVYFGEENVKAQKNLFKIFVKFSLIVGFCLLVILLVASPALVGLYANSNARTQEMAVTALYYCGLSMPLYILNNGISSYLQAINRLALSNLVLFLENFLISVIFALSFIGIVGVDAVWASYLACEIGTTVFYLILCAIRKKRGLTSPHLFLPEDFGPAEDDLLETHVFTMQEMIDFCHSAYDFCMDKTGNSRQANKVYLILEEAASNIIKHSHTDLKPHPVEIRVIFEDNTFELHFRDDGRGFDPTSYEGKSFDNSAEVSGGFGLQLLNRIPTSLKYIHVIDLNILIVKI